MWLERVSDSPYDGLRGPACSGPLFTRWPHLPLLSHLLLRKYAKPTLAPAFVQVVFPAQNSLPWDIHRIHFLTSFESLFKHHFRSEACPDHLFKFTTYFLSLTLTVLFVLLRTLLSPTHTLLSNMQLTYMCLLPFSPLHEGGEFLHVLFFEAFQVLRAVLGSRHPINWMDGRRDRWTSYQMKGEVILLDKGKDSVRKKKRVVYYIQHLLSTYHILQKAP